MGGHVITKPNTLRNDDLCSDLLGVLRQLDKVTMPRVDVEPVELTECARCRTRQPARRERCEQCAATREAREVCPKPPTSRWLIDDGILDEVAVERAVRGSRVSLTLRERDEAVRRLAGTLSDMEIGDMLGLADKTVMRIRQRNGWPGYKGTSYEVLERRGTANRAGLRAS